MEDICKVCPLMTIKTTLSTLKMKVQNERNVSASPRNQRLFAIRSFLKYARISNPELMALSMEASVDIDRKRSRGAGCVSE